MTNHPLTKDDIYTGKEASACENLQCGSKFVKLDKLREIVEEQGYRLRTIISFYHLNKNIEKHLINELFNEVLE